MTFVIFGLGALYGAFASALVFGLVATRNAAPARIPARLEQETPVPPLGVSCSPFDEATLAELEQADAWLRCLTRPRARGGRLQ